MILQKNSVHLDQLRLREALSDMMRQYDATAEYGVDNAVAMWQCDATIGRLQDLTMR